METSASKAALTTMVRLARLSRLNDIFLHGIAREYGLTSAEQTVLTTLRWMGPPYRQSPTDLAQVLLQSSGGVTATLHRLEARGLVRREADPTDRRRLLVALSPEGERVEAEMFEALSAQIAEMLETVPADDVETIARGVDLLLRVAERAAGFAD